VDVAERRLDEFVAEIVLVVNLRTVGAGHLERKRLVDDLRGRRVVDDDVRDALPCPGGRDGKAGQPNFGGLDVDDGGGMWRPEEGCSAANGRFTAAVGRESK